MKPCLVQYIVTERCKCRRSLEKVNDSMLIKHILPGYLLLTHVPVLSDLHIVFVAHVMSILKYRACVWFVASS